jgi:tetratricopeptide (TPR) repeat protein
MKAVFVLMLMGGALGAQQDQASVDQVRANADQIREEVRRAVEEAKYKIQTKGWSSGDSRRAYERGLRALDERRWDEAVEWFKMADKDRADAALYWLGFAHYKSGRMADALKALQALPSAHPNSRWLNDARALEVEIKQAQGKPVNPDAALDDELKLIALGGLVRSEPDKAMPYLEKLIQGGASPRVKREALWLVARSQSPKAKDMIVQIARTGNPDLQARAIDVLGSMDRQQAPVLLAQLYNDLANKELKQEVINSLRNSKGVKQLIDIARAEKDIELKKRAVRCLSEMNSKEANDFLLEILK